MEAFAKSPPHRVLLFVQRYPLGVAVCDKPGKLNDWVTATLAAFPFELNPPISFITFADGIQPKTDLRGLTAAQTGELAQTGVRIIDAAASGPKASTPAFLASSQLARLVTSDERELANLQRFAKSFRIPRQGVAVSAVIDAWNFSRGKPAPAKQADFVRMIDIVGRCVVSKDAMPREFIDALATLDPVNLRILGGTKLAVPLAELCGTLGHQGLIKASHMCLSNLVLACIVDNTPWQDIAAAVDKLDTAGGNSRMRAVDAALNAGLAEKVYEPRSVAAALDYIGSASSAGNSPAWDPLRGERMALSLARRKARAEVLSVVLRRAADQSLERLVNLCARLMACDASYTPDVKTLAEALGQALNDDLKSDDADAARRTLLKAGLDELVCHEIRSRLPFCDDPHRDDRASGAFRRRDRARPTVRRAPRRDGVRCFGHRQDLSGRVAIEPPSVAQIRRTADRARAARRR